MALDTDTDALARRLKALADPVRLRALAFLLEPDPACCRRDETVCACDLESHLGLSQPTVSHHMKQLVAAGLVRAERRGRWVHYELEPAAFAELRAALARFEAAPAGREVLA